MGPLIGVAAGWLIAGVLSGGFGLGGWSFGLLQQLLLSSAIVVFVMILRRRRVARGHRAVGAPRMPLEASSAATTGDRRSGDSSLDDGVRDIRRMDPKFDPGRFTGYIEMVFRGVHHARTSRDLGPLRDRVTSELYGELRARSEGLRDRRLASHVEQIEIRAEITEAWQESERDYVTAYIDGSMVDCTVDEAGTLVDGSKTAPEDVEAFLTFTRPSGLNPWMLSAIQTA
jgi:predicted lipid-binding transport protein (Tim44 family)